MGDGAGTGARVAWSSGSSMERDKIKRSLRSERRRGAPGSRTAVPVSPDDVSRETFPDSQAPSPVLARFLVERSNAAILVLRPDGSPEYVNPAACKLLGYSAVELETLPRSRWMPEDGIWQARWKDCRERGQVTFQTRLLTRTSEAIPAEIYIVHPASENQDRTCAWIRDLREERRLQEQLDQSQRLEAIGRLAGGIAHDFNNLLTVITGCTDLLVEQGGADPHLEEIRQAARRAADLVRQILIFSRKQTVEPKVLDIGEVVRRLEPMIRRLIGGDIVCDTIVRTDAGAAHVDPAQIEQVVINLCVNARDAMPNGGRLTIETDCVELDSAYASGKPGVRPGEYVVLAVSDTGMGMDRDTLSLVFEPFFTTKERDKGTGLGLSTAYGIVKRAGGNIWAYSEPGLGATFKVYLPRVDARVPHWKARPDRERCLQGSETVLLVEDDRHVRSLVERYLDDLGYRTFSAEDPDQALRLAREHAGDIQLLLTDLVLPNSNGGVLFHRLKNDLPRLRVLVMSGYAGNVAGPLASANVLPFIQKPFAKKALAARIREVLDSDAPEPRDSVGG